MDSMIKANDDDLNIAKGPAPDKEVPELLEDSPRTKKALETYLQHLEKSKSQLEEEFIDNRKAQRDKEAKKAEELSKVLNPLSNKEKLKARLDAMKPKENVKTAEYNLAKEGMIQDAKGVRYSKEKSVKKYLDDRKKNMINVAGSDEEMNDRQSDGQYQPPSAKRSGSLPQLVREKTAPAQAKVADKETTTQKILQKLKEK